MSDELRDKIARLPSWARSYIKRLETAQEPQIEEIVKLRRKVTDLQKVTRIKDDRIEAMVAMFQCTAKGGNEVARAVQSIVEDFLVSGTAEE